MTKTKTNVTGIRVRRADAVLALTFDRPRRRNALTVDMYEALTAALEEAAQDADIRVVTVSGSGGHFTAGNDLEDFVERPPSGEDSPVFRFLRTIATFEKPVLAAVEGNAVGIGTTLLLHCDVVYAADTARFQLPFVNLGLVPEAAASYLLPRLMGRIRASELLLYGEPFDAEKALACGIVNEIVPGPDLLVKVGERALALADRSPEALRHTKRLLRAPDQDAVLDAMRREGAVFVERLGTPEVRDVLLSFLKRRKGGRKR